MMDYRKRAIAVSLVLLGVHLSVGCQKRDQWQRVVVTGTVTYQQTPIAKGRIRFTPVAGSSGPVSVGTILDGRYRCDHLGGVSLGKHRVQIWAFDPNGSESPGPGGPPPKRILPEKFNDASELEVTIKSDSAEMEQNFALEP